jgi:FkbM family methyltransferase
VSRVRRVAKAMRALGIGSALRYDVQRLRRSVFMPPAEVTLTARRSKYALLARPQSTDFTVFGQTFISQPYACLDAEADVDLIVDCGANVGYAAAFLLSSFPNAHLVAIEPDRANYEVLVRNLAPYGDRASAHHAAVWSHNTELAMESTPYRGGGDWARQVRACQPGDTSTVRALDIPTILEMAGRQRISILKMDIEGAECEVLGAQGARTWLEAVDCLAIELHDDTHFGRGSDIFRRAIDGLGFTTTSVGELTICRRP